MVQNSLYQSVYSGEIEQSVFHEILGCLGYVTPQFVSREKFNAEYRDNFLTSTGKTSLGERYDLFLPEDLQHVELLRVIDVLNQDLDIEKYAKFDELLVKTKVAVIRFLREGGKQEKINEYIAESGISQELKERIEQANMMRNRLVVKEISSGQEECTSLEQVVSDIYGREFETTFLRDGINILRWGLMTFTRADARRLDGKQGNISERAFRWELDKEEKRLRDALDIDGWNTRLKLLRKAGDEKATAEAEIEFCKESISKLRGYPYQENGKKDSFLISIGETKEMHCLGFTIIIHAFLSELGIRHDIIGGEGHASVGLEIGGEMYMYEGTANLGPFINFFFKDVGFFKKDYNKEGIADTESSLLAFIYGNRGVLCVSNGQYEEAIKMYEKAIGLNPNDPENYLHKGICLGILGRHEEALKSYEEVVGLNFIPLDYHSNKGLSLRELGRFEEAIIVYGEAIQGDVNPGNIDYYHYYKGLSLRELGRYDEAVEEYDQAIALDPTQSKYHNSKGISLRKLGRYTEAIAAYDQAILLNPDSDLYRKNRAIASKSLEKQEGGK